MVLILVPNDVEINNDQVELIFVPNDVEIHVGFTIICFSLFSQVLVERTRDKGVLNRWESLLEGGGGGGSINGGRSVDAIRHEQLELFPLPPPPHPSTILSGRCLAHQ